MIPCRDDDVAFLADYKERRPELAKGFLCGNRFTADAACDKWLSWQFSVDRGLPFAPTLATPVGAQAETFASDCGFPLVAKPRRGFASRGISLVCNEAQLRRVAAQDGYVIQKYLNDPSSLEAHLRSTDQMGIPLFHSFEGTKISVEIFIAPNGSPAGNYCFSITIADDRTMRFERHQSAEAKALGEQCIRAFADAGWRGPMNIQCKLTPGGRLIIFEFNGRFNERDGSPMSDGLRRGGFGSQDIRRQGTGTSRLFSRRLLARRASNGPYSAAIRGHRETDAGRALAARDTGRPVSEWGGLGFHSTGTNALATCEPSHVLFFGQSSIPAESAPAHTDFWTSFARNR